jgi:hypothetical protein
MFARAADTPVCWLDAVVLQGLMGLAVKPPTMCARMLLTLLWLMLLLVLLLLQTQLHMPAIAHAGNHAM